jgi:hypothetical protein
MPNSHNPLGRPPDSAGRDQQPETALVYDPGSSALPVIHLVRGRTCISTTAGTSAMDQSIILAGDVPGSGPAGTVAASTGRQAATATPAAFIHPPSRCRHVHNMCARCLPHWRDRALQALLEPLLPRRRWWRRLLSGRLGRP